MRRPLPTHAHANLRAMAPLKTVVHAAMVLDDALIENLTDERNRTVIEPKAKAAAILDQLTRQDDLDHFILFSSATTLVGNPGQANYVAANGYLEGLRARAAASVCRLSRSASARSPTPAFSPGTPTSTICCPNASARRHEGAARRSTCRELSRRAIPGQSTPPSVDIADIDWSAPATCAVAAPAVRSHPALRRGPFAGERRRT